MTDKLTLDTLRGIAEDYCKGDDIQRVLLESVLERFIVLADEKLTSHPEAKPPQPDGWRLVPIDPWLPMLQSALQANRNRVSKDFKPFLEVGNEIWSADLCYRAMLDAAPLYVPPAGENNG